MTAVCGHANNNADPRAARRSEYRRSGVPAPTVECRIRDTDDRGVVEHRDISAIDRQLSLLAAVSTSIRRLGGEPSTALIDELLDERIACRRPPPGHAPAARAHRDGDATRATIEPPRILSAPKPAGAAASGKHHDAAREGLQGLFLRVALTATAIPISVMIGPAMDHVVVLLIGLPPTTPKPGARISRPNRATTTPTTTTTTQSHHLTLERLAQYAWRPTTPPVAAISRTSPCCPPCRPNAAEKTRAPQALRRGRPQVTTLSQIGHGPHLWTSLDSGGGFGRRCVGT